MTLESTQWYPSPTGIHKDPILTSHGIDQAVELASHITTLRPLVDKIYSSPFYRCVQTINYVADVLDQPIFIDNGIGEWYGRTTSSHAPPASPDVLRNLYSRVDTGYVPSLRPDLQGETMAGIHERVKQAIAYIIDDAERNNCQTILLCTHAATNVVTTLELNTLHNELILIDRLRPSSDRRS